MRTILLNNNNNNKKLRTFKDSLGLEVAEVIIQSKLNTKLSNFKILN
jgi:hypothetical protein